MTARPETGHAVTPVPLSTLACGRRTAGASSAAAAAASSAGASAGASSRIMCTLVPLTPKEEMPARRVRSPSAGHGTASFSSLTFPADHSMCGEGCCAYNVAGSRPCCSAITILMRPVTST